MSLDGLAYGQQGRTGRFGQVDGLSIVMLGKIPKVTIFIIGLPLGVTLDIDSQVLRVMDVDSVTARDFMIVARNADGTNLLGKEITSSVLRNFSLNIQVVRKIDLESFVEIVDE